MFKFIRIALLLTVLVLVGANIFLTQWRSTRWDTPLVIAVYPINADGSEKSKRYIDKLEEDDFQPVEAFFAKQAKRFNITLQKPVRVKLAEPLNFLPPPLPKERDWLNSVLWSLKFRYWSWQMKQNSKHAGADTHLYMLYHDSSKMPVLEHSVGLQQGMAGIVNAYSGRRYTGSNAVVLAHEFLHTLGATDKYDFATGQPLFPDGYAEPTRKPLYPQKLAELMGGHIPISPQETRMPRGLSQVVIGTKTAEEINWIGGSKALLTFLRMLSQSSGRFAQRFDGRWTPLRLVL